MKTRLISKAVMFAVFAMNTGAYAEGFNLERISKDTLDQAYIGEVNNQGVETSAFDNAAQTKAPAVAERAAAAKPALPAKPAKPALAAKPAKPALPAKPAKPALAAKVPMPATTDSKQYENASSIDDAVDAALFIPRVVASCVAAPIAIVMMVGGGGSVVKWLYRTIWGA